MKLSQLAAALGRPVTNPGAEDPEIAGIAALEDATAAHISFVTNARFASAARESRAAAFIVPVGTAIEDRPVLEFKIAWEGVLAALALFHPPRQFAAGVHPAATVEPSAHLAEGVSIQPHAVVEARARIGPRTVVGAGAYIGEDAVIGADCLLHPHVSVMNGCRLGDRVILQTGARIGADGFRYEKMPTGLVKIPQVGIVVLEDDVEVGANACIDRASFAETRVGRGTKIDNLVQIAHNVQVGQLCVLVSQVGIAGSVTIGDRTMLLGQAGVVHDIEIGSDVIVGAQAGVNKSIPAKSAVLGSPARPHLETKRIFAAEERLPELLRELRDLAGRVEALEGDKR